MPTSVFLIVIQPSPLTGSDHTLASITMRDALRECVVAAPWCHSGRHAYLFWMSKDPKGRQGSATMELERPMATARGGATGY
ncbi:hypothetical protein SESBI_12621 [Sesbania bispinosa]|nr:hypothetical protein SESBI_12621 [Sesbania bispinosa]